MGKTKKPNKDKHSDIRMPDEDIRLDKDESFKKSVEKVSKVKSKN